MAGVGDTTGRCTDVPETPILWLKKVVKQSKRDSAGLQLVGRDGLKSKIIQIGYMHLKRVFWILLCSG